MNAGSLQRDDSGKGFRRPDTTVLVREALGRNKDDPDALFVLAALRAQGGDLDGGLAILDRVLVIAPDYPGVWFFKERLHRMNQDPERAEEARRQGEASENR